MNLLVCLAASFFASLAYSLRLWLMFEKPAKCCLKSSEIKFPLKIGEPGAALQPTLNPVRDKSQSQAGWHNFHFHRKKKDL